MGGRGSGNWWRWNKRDTCEASLRIDLRYMRKNGMLRPYSAGSLSWSRRGEQTGSIKYRVHSHAFELDYRTRSNGGEWRNVNELVPLHKKDQPYGGTRLYLQCLGCGKNCLVLYGGAYFRCRKCQNLSYATQQENALGRLYCKSSRIREKFGDSGTYDDPFPPKPKGMHWKTYDRLRSEAEQAEDQVSFAMAGIMRGFLRE